MQSNYGVVAFLSIICGVVLLVSKLPILYFPGALLLLGGMFAPFIEDMFVEGPLKKFGERVMATAGRGRQVNDVKTAENRLVVKSESTGAERVVKTTMDVMDQLRAQLPTNTAYTMITLRVSGEDVTEAEAQEAKVLVQLGLQIQDVEVIADSPLKEGQFKEGYTGEPKLLKVSLEAKTDQRVK